MILFSKADARLLLEKAKEWRPSAQTCVHWLDAVVSVIVTYGALCPEHLGER